MKKNALLLILVIFITGNELVSQNSGTKTFYMRSSAYASFFRVGNDDDYREGAFLDGFMYGINVLADVKILKDDEIFISVGGSRESYLSVYDTYHVGTDTQFVYTHTVDLKANSVYAGVTIREHKDGDMAGGSITLGFQGMLPYSATLSLDPDPVTLQETNNEPFSPRNFALYVYGAVNLEIYPVENVFINIGLSYNAGISGQFESYNGYGTRTRGPILQVGLGFCF